MRTALMLKDHGSLSPDSCTGFTFYFSRCFKACNRCCGSFRISAGFGTYCCFHLHISSGFRTCRRFHLHIAVCANSRFTGDL